MDRSGTGEWGALRKSGPNGFLTVIASLVTLEQVTDGNTWREALEDVKWVLEQVVATVAVPDPTGTSLTVSLYAFGR